MKILNYHNQIFLLVRSLHIQNKKEIDTQIKKNSFKKKVEAAISKTKQISQVENTAN